MVAIPMSPKEVRAVVEGNRYDIAIIDCRSFGFGQNHKVPGAHIISCNSLVKRRSGGHTIPVGNIITADESREKLLNGEIKTVVVYDKDTQDLRSVPNDSDIKLVMRSLAEYKDISGPPRRLSDSFFFLEGGFDRYQEEYPGCVEQVSKAGPSSLQLNLKAPPAATHSSKSQMSGPVAVLPHLYLSDAEHASQAAVLEKLQIRFVVNVSKKAANHFPDRCTYFHIAVEDQADTDLGQYFEDTYKFIDSILEQEGKDGNVLVHCDRGISRSAAIVIAYLIKKEGITTDEAYNRVRGCRDVIDPNLGFMSQLMDYEKKLTSQKHRRARVQPLDPVDQNYQCLDSDVTMTSIEGGLSDISSQSGLSQRMPPVISSLQIQGNTSTSSSAPSNCSKAFQSVLKTTAATAAGVMFNLSNSQSPLAGGAAFCFD